MKKIFFTLSLILAVFILKAQDFNHVLVSVQQVNNKPAVIYVNYGDTFYLTFRDGKRQIDYKLNYLGSHHNMGITSMAYTAILPSNVEVKGLKIFIEQETGTNKKVGEPQLIFETDGERQKPLILKAL